MLRGVSRPIFVSQVMKLLKNIGPEILFLSETKISANKSMNILGNFMFWVAYLSLFRKE